MAMCVLTFVLGVLSRHGYEMLRERYRCPQCYTRWALKYSSVWQKAGMGALLQRRRCCCRCNFSQSTWDGGKYPEPAKE